MNSNQPSFKPIKHRIDHWEIIRARANALARERGLAEGDISLPAYLMEASDFFEKKRTKGKVQQ